MQNFRFTEDAPLYPVIRSAAVRCGGLRRDKAAWTRLIGGLVRGGHATLTTAAADLVTDSETFQKIGVFSVTFYLPNAVVLVGYDAKLNRVMLDVQSSRPRLTWEVLSNLLRHSPARATVRVYDEYFTDGTDVPLAVAVAEAASELLEEPMMAWRSVS